MFNKKGGEEMKNRKRIVALLLTGTLAMSMLGGCGNEGSAESSGTSQGETSVSDGEKDSTENSDTADNDVQEGAAEKDENGLVVTDRRRNHDLGQAEQR